MPKTDIWMPLYIGDYLSDTSHLTTEQHGAYLLLLMHYWKTGPLPNDGAVLAQITRMRPDAWSIAQAVLKSFFKLGDDGMLHQKRLDTELLRWNAKKLNAKEKASKAAESRWKNHAPSNAPSNASSNQQAMLGSCPSPSPSPLPKEQKQKQKQKPGANALFVEIPDWIPKDSWEGFVEMRQRIRYPLTTARAIRLTIGSLDKLRQQGHEPGAVLDYSTQHSYRGVFAPNGNTGGNTNGRTPYTAPGTRAAGNAGAFAEVLRKLDAGESLDCGLSAVEPGARPSDEPAAVRTLFGDTVGPHANGNGNGYHPGAPRGELLAPSGKAAKPGR